MFQVAYAAKDLKANVVVDMATLTGAQGVATGLYHAAVVTNNEDWEKASVSAGKSSGDLVVMHVALFVYILSRQPANIYVCLTISLYLMKLSIIYCSL